MSTAGTDERGDSAVLRTRQSWQRTALAAAAVALLLVRGLVIDGASRWWAIAAIAPGAAVVVIALVRGRGLARGDASRPGAGGSRPLIGAVVVGVVAVAVVGVATTLVG